MSTQRIASTPKAHIQSIAFQGIRVTDSYHQVVELVRKRRGDSYTLLFAEPSPSADGSAIDWYSPVQGPVRRLTELPEAEGQAMAARVAQMGQEIKMLAEELKGTGIQANVVRGTLLEMALRYPDNSHIYAVGGQPVITCWGFAPGTLGAQPEDLARLGEGYIPHTAAQATNASSGAVPPPPLGGAAATATSAPAQNRGCLGLLLASLLWLLPILLWALLLLVLFVPFGTWNPLITLPGLNYRLPALSFTAPDASLELSKLQAEGAMLQEDIQKLRLLLEQKAAQCPPAAPVAVPPVKEKPRESLVIPEKTADYGFLEGRWMNDAGLRNKEDGKPITVIYAFDGKGNGTVAVRQQGKQDCVGAATARFTDEGVLRIETERQSCPGENRAYSAEIIECRPAAAGKSSCLGRAAAGNTWGGSVYFYRMP